MFKQLTTSLPRHVDVAVSGGSDSMGALAFLTKVPGRVRRILHFYHGTDHGACAETFISELAPFLTDKQITVSTIDISDCSGTEDAWHRKRMEACAANDLPVVMGHHLQDAVEWFVMATFQGRTHKFIPPHSPHNVIRPFLLWNKDDLASTRSRSGLSFIQDSTNLDPTYCNRNYVRHMLKTLPESLDPTPQVRKYYKEYVLSI